MFNSCCRRVPGACGPNCAVEVVEYFQQLDEDAAFAALDFAPDVASQPRFDRLELLEGAPVVVDHRLSSPW